jgi:AraC-like DNA-binding protein
MTLFRDLGALSAVLEDLWRGPRRAFSIELSASAIDGEIIRKTFPFKIKFDCPRTVLTWPAALSDIELPFGSRRVHACYLEQCRLLQRKIPANELEGRIAHAIMTNPRVHRTIGTVARRLNLSARTEQRRLGDEGLTFRKILDQVQAEMAKKKLVETTLSIAQIADQLGYADRASFDVAFARWTESSPHRFREQERAAGTVVAG